MAQLITISGTLGSGKSTAAKALAKTLGFEYYSTGQAMRAIALKRNLTVLELNKLCKKDLSIDKEIDSFVQTLENSSTNYVVDSRLAFFFLPHSFKIKLVADILESAKRIWNDISRKNQAEAPYLNIDEVLIALKERRKEETSRFKQIYQVDIENESNFDLVLDTTYLSPLAVQEAILKNYANFAHSSLPTDSGFNKI